MTDNKYDQDWGSLFYYDETSPSCLRWRDNRCRGPKHCQVFIKKDSPVGSLNSLDGYWHVHVLGKMYNAHNIVWRMFGNKQGDLMLDHKDRDRSNTRINNLRLVTHLENTRNRNAHKNNKSKVNGVHYREIISRHGGGKFNPYWVASWNSTDGKVLQKVYSIYRLGDEEAFRLACEYRAKMIAELNEQGAGYTEHHGT